MVHPHGAIIVVVHTGIVRFAFGRVAVEWKVRTRFAARSAVLIHEDWILEAFAFAGPRRAQVMFVGLAL